MLKIVIFTASFGGGHNSIAFALQQNFQKYFSKEVSVQTIDFMERFAPRFNKPLIALYKQSIRYIPPAYGLFFKATDKLFRGSKFKVAFNIGMKGAREFLQQDTPDVIISVYPLCTQVLGELKKEFQYILTTVITDFGVHSQWLHPEVNRYYVASDDLKDDLIEKGIDPRIILPTGLPVRTNFLRKHTRAKIMDKFGLKDDFSVLIMSGEYGVGKFEKLCLKLSELPIQLIVVCGNNKRIYKKVSRLSKAKDNIKPFGFVKEIDELMSVSDILIGKAGGATVTEALSQGLPIIVYLHVPGQEIFNLDFLVNYGAGLYARSEEDIFNKVKLLIKSKWRLNELRENAKRLAKPDAGKKICQDVITQGNSAYQ